MTTIPPNQGASERIGMLVVKTANQWIDEASRRPRPRDLFNSLIYEGDTTIVFAETGAGKSMLAVQFGEDIARNETVVYVDCELSDMQFYSRYVAKDGTRYQFSNNLLRIEIDSLVESPAGMNEETHLIKSLEDTVISTGAKVVIIDNLTFLKNDTEKAAEALSVMRELKKLKMKHGLTVVVLAHTPKKPNTRPLTINDLAGSRHLANACDAMFAIGIGTTDPAIRYLRQFKSRYDEIIYTSENVIVYQLERRNDGFTGFTFLEYGNELNYIKEVSIMDKKERDEQVLVLHRAGHSNRAIGKELNISPMTVGRILERNGCYTVTHINN